MIWYCYQYATSWTLRASFEISRFYSKKTKDSCENIYIYVSDLVDGRNWYDLARTNGLASGSLYIYIYMCTVLFYRSLLLLVRSFCWSLTSLTIWLLSHMVLRTLCILDQPRTLIHAFLVNPSIPNRRKARVGLWKKSLSFLNKSLYVFAFFICVHICSSSLRNEVRNWVSLVFITLDE